MASDASQRAALPRRIYLDTQFVFAYLVDSDPDHGAAVRLANDLHIVHQAGSISAFISALVLDELAWKLAGSLYDTRHGRRAWFGAVRDEAFASVRDLVADAIEALLEIPWLRVTTADEEVCSVYASFLRRYPLLPADLAHLAIACSNGMDAIVTHDAHFLALADSPVPIVSYRRS